MVYRKITPEERLLEPDSERIKRQRREGMARARLKDPAKFNKRALEYHHADPTRKAEINLKRVKYNRDNPERALLAAAKSRAKNKGLAFDITLDDIIIPSTCPITGLHLFKGDKVHAASPTLDRIDNTKGYTKGNVAVISNRANSNKGDFTLEEIERLYFYTKGITYYN